MIKLHLFQEIQYQRSLGPGDLASSYKALRDNLFSMPEGGEVCFAIDYSCSDAVAFALRTAAVKDPPDTQTLKAIQSGLPVPRIPSAAFCLEAGDYLFEQLAALPEPGELEGLLCRFCLASSGVLFLRVLREGPVAFIAQIFVAGRS